MLSFPNVMMKVHLSRLRLSLSWLRSADSQTQYLVSLEMKTILGSWFIISDTDIPDWLLHCFKHTEGCVCVCV